MPSARRPPAHSATGPVTGRPAGRLITLVCAGAAVPLLLAVLSVLGRVQTDTAATVTLTPYTGPAGTVVQVTGDGFTACWVNDPDNPHGTPLSILWDGSDVGASGASVDSTGYFSAQLQVPADATAGDHTVEAGCVPEQTSTSAPEQQPVSAQASFTVVAGTSTTTNPPPSDTGTSPSDTGTSPSSETSTSPAPGGVPGSPPADGGGGNSEPTGWVGPSLLGVVLLAIAAAVYFGARHRGPSWVRRHVRTVPRPGLATASAAEAPHPASPTRTVRLEPHADPGEQTIEEVDE